MLFVIQFYIIKIQDAALCSALCILNSSSDNHTRENLLLLTYREFVLFDLIEKLFFNNNIYF